MKKEFKCLLTIILVLVTLLLVNSVNGENNTWDCPECGRTGNTGNYCGSCAYPAPWLESANPQEPTQLTEDPSTPFQIIGGKCGDFLTWQIDETTLTISGIGEMYDYEVNQAPWNDYKAVIQTVTINSGVASIGQNAFREYNLSEINLPNSLKRIKYGAFCGNNNYLRSVILPEGLETIEGDAFAICSNLATIVFPNTLKTIGRMAFQGAAFESITLPAGVTTIIDNPFCCCKKLAKFSVQNNTSFKIINSALYSADGKHLIAYPFGSTVTHYEIASGTEVIDTYSLYGNQYISELVIPEGVKEIGNTLSLDTTIEKVYLPRSLTVIYDSTFTGCDHLTIYCYENSSSQQYAINHNIPYKIIGGNIL